jgi:HAD superfamily hydrolase (TIGR01509 family)
MRLPNRPGAVIFDMDGLLFDNEALHQETMIAALFDKGYDTSAGISDRIIGCNWDRIRAVLLEHFGATFPAEDFVVAWARKYDEMALTRLAMKPGVVELLDMLDRLQIPRAIATSARHHRVQHHLAAHDLVGRFHEIVGHGDYPASKPAPDPFLKAAERLGVEPRLCLALEDSYNGVRSAAAAGMMTIMVPDLLEPTEEVCALCVHVARDLHEVHDLVLASVR